MKSETDQKASVDGEQNSSHASLEKGAAETADADTGHSPLPWHTAKFAPEMIVASDQARVADCSIAIGMDAAEIRANAELIVKAVNSYPALVAERDRLVATLSGRAELELEMLAEVAEENDALRAALEKIERWFGEFPDTGKTWDDGSPMSYAACYGTNGERDYMREVARVALATKPDTATASALPPIK